MPKHIDADALLSEAKKLSGPHTGDGWDNWGVYALIERQPAANVYIVHDVAVILAEVTGDDCACNVHGNDEWLPMCCEFAETVCPDPGGVACWEQYLKWREKRKENQ